MTSSPPTAGRASPALLVQMIEDGRCVVLDGGVATELQRHRSASDEGDLWGTWALSRAPRAVLAVHRSYAETGCHVLSTDTWSILSAPEIGLGGAARLAEAQHWMDIARLGVRLARQAIDEAGRAGECAVAFAISEEANSSARRETLELLVRALADDPPDLILMETMTLIREPATFETIELLLGTGLPVCGSRFAAAGTVCVVCKGSIGARRRETSSAEQRGASRRWVRGLSS